MKLEELVLIGDLSSAVNLITCYESCIARSLLEIRSGDAAESARWATEAARCMRDLDEIFARKRLDSEMRMQARNSSHIVIRW